LLAGWLAGSDLLAELDTVVILHLHDTHSRLEAQYAFQSKLPMIPLMLERGYSPGKRKRRHFSQYHFILNMITLPRQARDKHRLGTTQKRVTRFCADGWLGILHSWVRRKRVACLQPFLPSYVCPEPVL
jgi:hypothetical protein